MTTDRARPKEEVLQEFPPIGKYRVRLLRIPGEPTPAERLDIREYIASNSFEGFTRRGIQITSRAEMDLLRDILEEVLERTS